MQSADPLRILLLEDSEIDAELIESHLQRLEERFEVVRTSDRASFETGLAQHPDVVLADYSLPNFDGLAALAITRERSATVPFIFVSGVVGEEFATRALQQGAVDYITKRNLRRLPTAIRRAVAEARERQVRRRTEEALRASEIGSRFAMAAARLGSWDHDLRAGRLSLDSRAKALLGLDPLAEVTHADFEVALHPEDRGRVRVALDAAMRSNGSSDFDEQFRVVAPDGDERWLEIRGQAIFEHGQCVRFVAVVRDITLDKRAETEMLQRAASLQASVEERTQERDRIWRHSHDLLAVADRNGFLRGVNPAWTLMLGYAGGEVLAHPLAGLIHPEDLDAFAIILSSMRRNGKTQRFENRVRRVDGNYLWVSWTIVPAGETLYAIGRDITETRKAADELASANQRLREQIGERERAENALRQMQRLEAIGQLTSGVAHDFNNLLTVILGNLGFLDRSFADEPDDSKVRRRLSHMRIAAERGAKLTAQLLAFSRRQRLEPQVLDLNEAITSIHPLLETTLGGSVSVRMDLQSEPWLALVDPTQLELIVLNLAINARDAMEVGGELIIATRNLTLATDAALELEAGDYIEISVADTGSGMTQEVLAKALEPFFTTKEVGKGSGLGLAQVYGFARQSGGAVRIDTEVGQGTTVRVYIPRASGAAQADENSAEPQMISINGQNHAILLVDDDDAVRDVTASILRERGYEVVEAGSGQEALAVLGQRDGFDLLLVDYAMPGMNGGDVVRAARASHPDLAAIFLTGYADLTDLKNFPTERVLQKPFEPNNLIQEVHQAIQRSAAES